MKEAIVFYVSNNPFGTAIRLDAAPKRAGGLIASEHIPKAQHLALLVVLKRLRWLSWSRHGYFQPRQAVVHSTTLGRGWYHTTSRVLFLIPQPPPPPRGDRRWHADVSWCTSVRYVVLNEYGFACSDGIVFFSKLVDRCDGVAESSSDQDNLLDSVQEIRKKKFESHRFVVVVRKQQTWRSASSRDQCTCTLCFIFLCSIRFAAFSSRTRDRTV